MNSKQFANCKLKEGIPGEPCEDDLMLFTRVESSSTTCNLEMQCSTPKRIEELPEGTATLMLTGMHKKKR